MGRLWAFLPSCAASPAKPAIAAEGIVRRDGSKVSILYPTSLSGNALTIGAAGVTHNNITLQGVGVVAGLATARTDATVYIVDVNTFKWNDILIFYGQTCLQLENSSTTPRYYVSWIEQGVISSCGTNVLIGSLATTLSGTVQGPQFRALEISSATNYGLDVRAENGMILSNIDFIANGYAMIARPGSGTMVQETQCLYANFNGSVNDGLTIEPTGTGIVSDFNCTNAVASTNGGHGIVINGSNSTVRSIQFTATSILNNGLHGFWYRGSAQQIHLSGDIHQNNITNSSACAGGAQCDGVHVDANAGNFHFRGHSGVGGPFASNFQRYGLAIEAGTGEYISVDGTFNGNVTGGVLNGAAGTQVEVHDRTPTTGSLAIRSPKQTYTGRFKISDQGSCTMTAGACAAQSLVSTYAAAPNCVCTLTGTGALAGKISCPSTTTASTPASSDGADTAVVNWLCLGN